MAIPYTRAKNTEERIIGLLENFSLNPDAKTGQDWIRRYGSIVCAYAEYTGGHISLETLMKTLTEECFL